MYRVIADDLLARISNGEFPVSSRLPTETELAARYGVSRMTARQAVDQLENARLVVRHRGSGSYVRAMPGRTRGMNSLRSFAEELTTAGSTVESRVLAQEELDTAPEDVRDDLAAAGASRFVRLARVRLVDGVPAAYQEAWVPFHVAPGLAREELSGQSLYRTFAERYGIELGWGDQQISAEPATKALAAILEVQPGTCLLTIRRITYSDKNFPVEAVRSWTRPEFPLAVQLNAR